MQITRINPIETGEPLIRSKVYSYVPLQSDLITNAKNTDLPNWDRRNSYPFQSVQLHVCAIVNIPQYITNANTTD